VGKQEIIRFIDFSGYACLAKFQLVDGHKANVNPSSASTYAALLCFRNWDIEREPARSTLVRHEFRLWLTGN
jgi:hypothetical protein